MFARACLLDSKNEYSDFVFNDPEAPHRVAIHDRNRQRPNLIRAAVQLIRQANPGDIIELHPDVRLISLSERQLANVRGMLQRPQQPQPGIIQRLIGRFVTVVRDGPGI